MPGGDRAKYNFIAIFNYNCVSINDKLLVRCLIKGYCFIECQKYALSADTLYSLLSATNNLNLLFSMNKKFNHPKYK